MKSLSIAAMVMGSALAMVSCSNQTTKTAEKAEMTRAELTGEWNIVAVNGHAVQVEEGAPFISFDMAENKVNGNAGCNRFFGQLNAPADTASAISFGNMGMTRMMCHNDSLEMAVVEALNSVKGFKGAECAEHTCADLLNNAGETIITIQKK